MALIEKLFDGPLDVVGDVHGDRQALDNLLDRLGYGGGEHKDGRRLVFVGDLVDRGPDSPGVLHRVKDHTEAGIAQCVLGNHDVNTIREEPKNGSEWWFDTEAAPGANQEPVADEDRVELAAWLTALPIALENDSLRVVHACWNEPSIRMLEAFGLEHTVLDAYYHFEKVALASFRETPHFAMSKGEYNDYRKALEDENWNGGEGMFLEGIANKDVHYQMNNPVRMMNSGMEGLVTEKTPMAIVDDGKPFFANKRWRMAQRLRWWNEYNDSVPVVVGHYWRRYDHTSDIDPKAHGPDLFAEEHRGAWMGANRNVFCVDFSAAGRVFHKPGTKDYDDCKLAALRMPAKDGDGWEVLCDDGDRWDVHAPGAKH